MIKVTVLVAALSLAGVVTSFSVSAAQVVGTTTVGVTVTEMNELVMGWSAKTNIMGKTVYNESGQSVGKVEDIIIAPDKNVSYLIIGAGGFIGIGRHDVAIPVAQLRDQAGKIVLPGATKEIVKALPRFEYASSTSKRERFIANADQSIATAKAKVAEYEKKALTATDEAKARMDKQIVALREDVKSADDNLSAMRRGSVAGWKEFEGKVSAAIARLQLALETAIS